MFHSRSRTELIFSLVLIQTAKECRSPIQFMSFDTFNTETGQLFISNFGLFCSKELQN